MRTEILYKEEVFQIVGVALEVYKELGYGFLESVYQEAMELEAQLKNVPLISQSRIDVYYKGLKLRKGFIADFLAYDQIIVEIKCVPELSDIETAQLLNYLKATGKQLGVLINFGSKKGLEWKRYIYTPPL